MMAAPVEARLVRAVSNAVSGHWGIKQKLFASKNRHEAWSRALKD